MPSDISGFETRLTPGMIERYRSDNRWADMTLADHARTAVAESPDATILVEGDREWSRQEIFDRACRLGAGLRALGLEPGDVLSSQLPNWHEAALINLAAAMNGFIINPVVPIQRDKEVCFSLTDSRSRLIFIPGNFRNCDYLGMLRRIRPQLPPIKVVVVRHPAAEFLAFEDLLHGDAMPPPEKVDPNRLKMIMFTSGTTGRSKGVLHSHNTLMAETSSIIEHWGIGIGDRILMPSPVSHIAGTLWALEVPWVARASAVLMDVWAPDEAVRLIDGKACSIMSGATVFLQDLLAASRRHGSALPSLRLFVSGGAPIPAQLVRDAYAAWPGCLTVKVYGSTEASSVTYGTLLAKDIDHAANTDGRIRNWEVRLCDPDTGVPLPPGKEGEILVRGPELCLGYTRAEDNEPAFDKDGFFRTGDVGKIVDGEYLVITDRKKDLIIRGGENLSAREIEDTLSLYPGITAAAAVSMPCARMGETVCAFVEASDGTDLSVRAIAAFMIDHGLARQKIPERIERMPSLPRTASGKIRKGDLRALAASFAEGRPKVHPSIPG